LAATFGALQSRPPPPRERPLCALPAARRPSVRRIPPYAKLFARRGDFFSILDDFLSYFSLERYVEWLHCEHPFVPILPDIQFVCKPGFCHYSAAVFKKLFSMPMVKRMASSASMDAVDFRKSQQISPYRPRSNARKEGF